VIALPADGLPGGRDELLDLEARLDLLHDGGDLLIRERGRGGSIPGAAGKAGDEPAETVKHVDLLFQASSA
jgi:hypothetical protein